MKPNYFEDYTIGDKFTTPRRTITDADATILVGLCQFIHPMFVDGEAARSSVFGGRILPGAVVLSFMAGLTELANAFDFAGFVGALGMNNVKFISPLKVGDTLYVEVEIIAKKETRKPDRGVVTFKQTAKNQRGETIAEAEVAAMILRRQSS